MSAPSAPSTPRTGADAAAAVSHGVALANGRADGPFGYGAVSRHRCDCLQAVPNAMWVLALPTLAVAGVAAVAARHAVPHDLWLILAGNALLSIGAYVLTLRLIPVFIPYLLKGGLDGVDIGKPGRREDKTPIPESLGVVPGVVYIIAVTFSQLLYGGGSTAVLHSMLVEYNAALHSIGFMIFLGFADDVVDLPWRYKLILPTVATLPLLVAYSGSTLIIVPKPLRFILGGSIELGVLYQVYMGLLAVFCTNAINIYAGINGLEVTQSVIIGCAVCVHNVMELCGVAGAQGMLSAAALPHVFSLCLTLPFVCASLGLLHHNTYPSRVFVGDTYTYFAGMTFAVVGILGHFSKTLLLFFIPQILNFLISVPQLFGYVPCPRHRLPLINQQTGLLEGQKTNWNLLNVFLLLTGPMHERTLNIALALLQVACCALGLFVRYVVSGWVF